LISLAGEQHAGYVTKFACDSPFNFVRGGMNFSEEEQRLYFPKCGYYHVSSQVLFQYHEEDTPKPNKSQSAQHGIEIKSNCDTHGSQFFYSHANLEQKTFAKSSTYISGVAKVCEGGSMRVFITKADFNGCCVDGTGMMTHFSAFLIQKAPCS